MTIEGIATDADGNRIRNAKVAVFLSDQSAGATGTVKWTETDSNGNFVIERHPDGTGNTQSWHVAGEYTDGSSNEFNAFSKPYVSASINAIPDSVVHQYDFVADWSQGATSVPDGIGSADMSLTGDPVDATIGGESGAEGDGTDGYGSADGPQTIPQNQSMAIAFTYQASGLGGLDTYMGSEDGSTTNRLRIYTGQSGTAGDIQIDLSDGNDNFLRVYTNNQYDDGTPHAVVINKTGNNASDISIYVDDMTTPVSDTDALNEAFDNTAYSNTQALAAWAWSASGSIQDYINSIYGVLEFNSAEYSESERQDFVSRRPEV